MFQLLYRVLHSRRIAYAILGNGTVSLTNFIVSISIARVSSISIFGAFSIAMVVYFFSTGLVRAAFTNTALSKPNELHVFQDALRRTSLISFFISLVILGWGILGENWFLTVLGVSLHGLLILDFIRTFQSAVGEATKPFIATTVWSLFPITAFVCSFFYEIDPILIFSLWSLSGALAGYLLFFTTIARSIRSKNYNHSEVRTSLVFTADYLVGSGGSHLTTGALGLIDDARILGAIRGAGTLLGPVNLIATTAYSLTLPFLSRLQNDPNKQFRSALAAALLQATILGPALLALQFIPDQLGEQLLGDTWHIAQIAILPMSIDSICAVIMSPAVSGHRVASAGARSILLQLLISVPRIFLVMICAFTWGVAGAAWAMAVMALFGAVIWWVSYANLCRTTSGPA